MEIAQLLGPPQAWMPSQEIGSEPVPRYWFYGKLELVVRFDEVPACVWFQIEHASQLPRKIEFLTDDFAIDLHDLSGRSRMSDFILAIKDIDRVTVQLRHDGGTLDPTIFIDGAVEIGFGWEGTGDPPGTDHRRLIPWLNRKSRVIDIVSERWGGQEHRDAPATRRKKFSAVTVTGREFLAAI